VAAFVVYLATLSSGVLGGDAGELQFVPPILGLTHPTGYPLQVLLHKAWSILPFGTVAYRLNVLDAALAACAVAIVASIVHHLSGRWAAGAIGACCLAFGELWWSQAVRGDKYTLNGLFLAVVLLLFLRWRERPTPARLASLAFVFGLGLAHHRSMLLVIPALVAGLAMQRWRPRNAGEAARLGMLVLAPLLLYAYVPWAGSRGLPPGSWPVDTPAAFAEFLLDRGYTSQIRPDAALVGRLGEELRVLLRSFGPLGVLLGMLGLSWGVRHDWRATVVLVMVALPQAVLGASYVLESNYQLPRHWVFFLPGFVVWSIWVGLGAHATLAGVERLVSVGRLGPLRLGPTRPGQVRIGRSRRSSLVAGACIAGILVVQGGTAWLRAAEPLIRAEAGAETLDAWRQDLQRSPLADRFGRLALERVAPASIIVCDWEQATVLWYLQRVEGIRPDVSIRYPIERLDQTLADAAATDTAVYVARTLPGLESRGVTSSDGPLVRVAPPPASALPPDATSMDQRFEGGISLVGIEYHARTFRAGSVVPFTLYWRADTPLSDDVAVSVRLMNEAGDVLAAHDERHPALGTSPTSRWRLGDVIGDYRELPLGARLPAGSYRIVPVPYRVDPRFELRRLGPDGAIVGAPNGLEPFAVARSASLVFDLLGRLRGR